MKIPEKIRIAGIDYEVKRQDVVLLDYEECMGKIEFATSTIELSRNHGTGHQMLSKTLLHEILHGIIYHYNGGENVNDEERIVELISKGLYQVLQDNGGALFDLAQPTQEHTCSA